jgi:hypothetical protein
VHAHQNYIGHSSLKITERVTHARLDTIQDSCSFVIQLDQSGKRKENFRKIFADHEDEDDKLISFKKYLEINNYFTAGCYAHPPGYFCSYIKKWLSSCKLFCHFPSQRYLALQVIRI